MPRPPLAFQVLDAALGGPPPRLMSRDDKRHFGYAWCHKPPLGTMFGRRLANGLRRAKENPTEILILRRIRDWVEAGWGPTAIANHLNSLGVKGRGRPFYKMKVIRWYRVARERLPKAEAQPGGVRPGASPAAI